MATIIANILDANLDANIYVMGYFNPLPTLATISPAANLTLFVATINDIIQGAVLSVSTTS